MAEKCILFADADTKALDDLSLALGPQWHVTGVAGGMAALAEMQSRPYNVVIANLDLAELDGAELLNHIRVSHPETIRFIAAASDMKERVINQVVGGHQFLAKPFDKSTLKSTIERSVSADSWMVNSSMRELVGRIRTFPTIPTLYLEVINALNNPDTTTEDVGAIVAKDMAMTTKLLQVLNSAYFSLPRTITDPAEAVGILGFETIKSLIMSVKLMSQYDKIKPVYFSIDNIWRHSTNVARIAREFALMESGDSVLAASAYSAGLMHDLGKVILAANFDQQYSGAHALARRQQLPLWEVEKDIFGASHGEIGAYLFGLWGMPSDIIEATALHHYPARAATKKFSALTAVHVANALEYDGNPSLDGLIAPMLDMQYLDQLDLIDRLGTWRDAAGNTSATSARPQQRSTRPAAEKSAKTAPASPPVAAVPEAESAPAKPAHSWTLAHRIYGGLALAAVMVLLCCLEFKRVESAPADSGIAQAPAISGLKSQSPATPVAVMTPPATPPAAPQTVISQTVIPARVVDPSPPAAAIATPAQPSPTDLALNDLKLQGIFFSAGKPWAIINGKQTFVNELVADCRVLDISRASVTLEYQNQRRTITLK